MNIQVLARMNGLNKNKINILKKLSYQNARTMPTFNTTCAAYLTRFPCLPPPPPNYRVLWSDGMNRRYPVSMLCL